MNERFAGAFSRPGWPHVPGVTPGPDEGPLDAAKATVPSRFGGPVPADHPALGYGLALCDTGFFWEAHEVLEAVWMASPPNSRDRHALRAVIQIANAGLKLKMGRRRAALRLLAEARDLLGEVGRSGGGAAFADRLDAAGLSRDIGGLAISLMSETEELPIPGIGSHLAPMQEISHS